MRLGLVLLAFLLAGCTSVLPGSENPAQPFVWRAFEARFELRDLPEAEPWILELSLGPPRAVADQMLASAPAYPLRMAFHPEGRRLEEITFWIDGERLVREDHECGVFFQGDGSDCGKHMEARWDVGGFLPPLGIAWPQLARDGGFDYLHLGLRQHTELVGQKERGLAGDAPTPWGLYYNARNRFQYGEDDWVPAAIELHAALGRHDQVFAGKRVALHVGDILPPLQPWGRDELRRDARPSPRLFAAADQQVFDIGITYEQALDGLLNGQHRARDIMAGGGCVVSLSARPLVGDSPLPDGVDVWARERMFFDGMLADAQGAITEWSWSYSKPVAGNPNPGDLLGPSFFTEAGYDSPLLIPCTSAFGLDVVDPATVLRQAWQLPLDAGVPCGLRYDRARASNFLDHAMGPVTFAALLTLSTGGGNRPTAPMTFNQFEVKQDAQAGVWSSMHLPTSDWQRLDAGGWTARSLPPDEQTPTFGPTSRCLPAAEGT